MRQQTITNQLLKKVKITVPLMLLVLALVFTVSVDNVSAADGDVIYVNGTSGLDTNNGYTPDTAKLTIGNAVGTVNTNGVVNIADGIYTGTSNTGITIGHSMNITGQSQTGTIIDGADSAQIFYIPYDVTVTIQNLTLKNGTENGYYGGGGAISNDGTLTLNDCTLTGNTASYGGAINNDGTATITGCTFINNTADVQAGAFSNEGTSTIINCIFTGNTAIDGSEGGGAINDENSDMIITGCTFTGNTATNGDGGAIYNCCGDQEIITGCTFTGNTASRNGGAIYTDQSCTVNFSRFVGNTAGNTGDAIYNDYSDLNAQYNWWGSNANPKTIPKLISGDVDFVDADPWLMLSIVANPSEVINTMTSQVTVNLYKDSDSVDHSSEFAKYPAEIPLTFATTWGSITQALMKYGTATATFTANGGSVPSPNVATVSAADSANPTATVTTPITIKTASNIYIKISSNNNNPNVGETSIITYKLGNNGPDAAQNVVTTILLPNGFELINIGGDGTWIYNAATRTITWTMANVPVGDPYLYLTGRFTVPGTFLFGSSINSDTYNLNTQRVTPLTINAATQTSTSTSTSTSVKAANTIGMQTTGAPLLPLAIAVFSVLGGLAVNRRK